MLEEAEYFSLRRRSKRRRKPALIDIAEILKDENLDDDDEEFIPLNLGHEEDALKDLLYGDDCIEEATKLARLTFNNTENNTHMDSTKCKRN